LQGAQHVQAQRVASWSLAKRAVKAYPESQPSITNTNNQHQQPTPTTNTNNQHQQPTPLTNTNNQQLTNKHAQRV